MSRRKRLARHEHRWRLDARVENDDRVRERATCDVAGCTAVRYGCFAFRPGWGPVGRWTFVVHP
jgi:hypothetical protein